MKSKWLMLIPLIACCLMVACNPVEPDAAGGDSDTKEPATNDADSAGKVKAETPAKSVVSAKPEDAASLEEGLTEGMLAPEIKGEDIDGEVFSLSDYRGKVVMLDFWGDW